MAAKSTVYNQRHADKLESRPDEAKQNDMCGSHQDVGNDEENKNGNSLLSMPVLGTEVLLRVTSCSSVEVDVFKQLLAIMVVVNPCSFSCCFCC